MHQRKVLLQAGFKTGHVAAKLADKMFQELAEPLKFKQILDKFGAAMVQQKYAPTGCIANWSCCHKTSR